MTERAIPEQMRHLVSEGITPGALTRSLRASRLDTGNIFMVRPTTPETPTHSHSRLPSESVLEEEARTSPINRFETRDQIIGFAKAFKEKSNEDPMRDPFVDRSGNEWSTGRLAGEYLALDKKIKQIAGEGNFTDEEIWNEVWPYSRALIQKLEQRLGKNGEVRELFLRAATQSKDHPVPGAAKINMGLIDVSRFTESEVIRHVNTLNSLRRAGALTKADLERIRGLLIDHGGDEANTVIQEMTVVQDESDEKEEQVKKEREEKEEQKKEKSRDPKKTLEEFRKELDGKTVNEMSAMLKPGQPFGNYLRQILKDSNMTEEAIEARINAIDISNALNYKKGVDILSAEAYRKYKNAQEGIYGKVPNDIQELAFDIMDKSAPEWQVDNDYELVDKEGNLNKGNFIRWLRTQAMYWDSFSPDDKTSFFSEIKTPTTPRQYSFQEMVSTDSFFIDRKTGLLMDKFRDQCLHEIWLLNDARNWDVEYRRAMGEEDKTAQVIQGLFYTNTFTKLSSGVTTMERILKMSKNQDYHKEKIIDPVTGEEKIIGADEGDQLIGKGVRHALLAYNYLGDINMMREILGDEADIFSMEYKQYDPEPITEHGRQVMKYKETTIKKGQGEKWSADWYDPVTKRLKFDDPKAVEAFEEYIKIFDGPKPDPRVAKEIRERMSASIRRKINKIVANKNQSLPKEKKLQELDLVDSNYAENWAFKMCRWTGIASKGSYDAWSKFQDTQEYRQGQFRAKRKGFYGNPYSVDSFKGMSANVMNGMVDVKGRTLLEIIQGGQGDDVNDLEEDIDSFYFANNSMQKFADDHMVRAQKIFDFVINNNEMDFRKFVKTDPVRGVVFDPAKAREVIDGISKHIRYAYETWDGLDLGKVVHAPVRYFDREENKWVNKVMNVTMAEKMFGGAILDEYKLGTSEDPLERQSERQKALEEMWDTLSNEEKQIYEKYPDINIDIAKLRKDHRGGTFWHNIVRELVAREIQSRTDKDSPYEPYTYEEREHIFHFLEHHYFGKEETEKIRKIADTPWWKLFAQAIGLGVLGGLVEGTWKGGQDASKIIMK